jgi:hypothetical protein
MLHRVLFTWYAVIMLLFNLIKGAALATTRIILMVLLNVSRFADFIKRRRLVAKGGL